MHGELAMYVVFADNVALLPNQKGDKDKAKAKYRRHIRRCRMIED
jgi:hypothetical protein